MSSAALQQGVRDWLREQLVLTPFECDLTDDGQPHPGNAGPLFVGIHPGDWIGDGGPDYGLRELFGVQITVSYRGTQFQVDRWGQKITGTVASGIGSVSRLLVGKIHCNLGPLQKANTTILEGVASAFVLGVYLRFRGGSIPRRQKAEWWGAATPQNISAAGQWAGMSQTLKFFGAMRVQSMSGAELE